MRAFNQTLRQRLPLCKEGAQTSNSLAFEDTQISRQPAVRAGLLGVAALSEWATKQDFSKALFLVKELSEVDGLDPLP